MPFTNKGAAQALAVWLRDVTNDANMYLALVTSATAPTVDTNTLGELTEIAAGNGYTAGGYTLTPGATDFDVITEDDANDRADIQIKDIVWTASGGPIPASGGDARYLVLTGPNATVANREVYFWWDLGSDRNVSSGQPFTLEDFIIRLPSGSGWTNKGAYELLSVWLRNTTVDTNFYIGLVTAAPNADTNTLSDLTEITAGNGYTAGGTSLTPGVTDFDVITEDDTNDRADVQVKNVAFTASGGPIPASGSDALYAVMMDNNATAASREVYLYWSLTSGRAISDGETLTLEDFVIRLPAA